MNKQSTEPVSEPATQKEFDTKTPANLTVHRFTLNDIPKYADKLYPHLKERFPHLHERMYGGWLRSCIEDNSTFFVCGDATVAMAKAVHDPLDPRPMVDVVFCLGAAEEMVPMYKEILKWAKNYGATEVRARDAWEISRALKHHNTDIRKITVFRI